MKNVIVALLLSIISILCMACGSDIPDVVDTGMGTSFQSSKGCKEGYLTFTVNNFQYSDNVKDFDIDPVSLADQYDFSCIYYNKKEMVIVDSPLDTETGELDEHLLFVLVDVTVTNVNAITYNGDGTAVCIDCLQLIDSSSTLENNFVCWRYCYNEGTGVFDAKAMGMSADNYYSILPGESLTYQIGFIIGSAKDDFSHIYLTNCGGSYYSDDAKYVYLDILSE